MKFFSLSAFKLWYPQDLISVARRGRDTDLSFSAESREFSRRLAMAFSTFFHEVFCVRIAPVAHSSLVFAGHQFCGPYVLWRTE